MLLLKSNGVSTNTITSVELEMMADDLLMITINNDVENQAKVFNYWRLIGNRQNPPLEIGVDIDKKTVHSLTLFIEKHNFITSKTLNIHHKKGNMIIDTNIFKVGRYIDAEGLYSVSLNEKTFKCIFNNTAEVNEGVINGRIEYYLTNIGVLCGFAICNLSDYELDEFRLLLNNK